MRDILKRYGTLLGLALIVITFLSLKPSVFPTLNNWQNILEQNSLLAIMAIGATVVVVIGEFDLSIGSVASFAGILAAVLFGQDYPVYLVVFLVLLSSLLFGLINGFFVSKLNIPSFITTLASSTFLGGITYWISGGKIIFSGIPDTFLVWGQGEVFGVPIVILVAGLTFFVFLYTFNQTMLGRHLYAIGGNEKAARYSGVQVEGKKILTFGMASVLAALAGLLLTSKLSSAHPTAGEGYLLQSYATVFLGMTLFKQGEPNVPGTLVGVLIMGVLANGLTILGVSTYFQDMLTGSIIIAALIFQGLNN